MPAESMAERIPHPPGPSAIETPDAGSKSAAAGSAARWNGSNAEPSQPADWPWGMSTPVLAMGPGKIMDGGRTVWSDRIGPAHGAEVGGFFAGPAETAGLEQLVAGLMDRGRVVIHGPDSATRSMRDASRGRCSETRTPGH